MILKYIEHFETGHIDDHKEAQRFWVRDKAPVLESNMGWIMTYIDPENIRASFDGWVAIVDKKLSEKFKIMADNSEKIIPQLPWPKEMEKDNFIAPDFTIIDVINFADYACPSGLNLPNYNDVVESEGFKNVLLGNSLVDYYKGTVEFATEEQAQLLAKHNQRCYEVHVACHELFGHGTGKLIYRNPDGTCPSFTDPITNEIFESCYEEGENWNTKFGSISRSYEECRADACGFHLSILKDVYSLFGF